MNCAVIMGRLTADPELRTTQNGLSVTSFTVAVNRPYSKQGEERQADFINVVAWRQTAEFVTRYFQKGSMIAIQGRIQTRTYEDKSGNKRYATEVVADRVSFTGSRQETGTSGGSQAGGYTPGGNQDTGSSYATGMADDFDDLSINDDDLPF